MYLVCKVDRREAASKKRPSPKHSNNNNCKVYHKIKNVGLLSILLLIIIKNVGSAVLAAALIGSP